MEVHAVKPSTSRQRQADLCESEVSLVGLQTKFQGSQSYIVRLLLLVCISASLLGYGNTEGRRNARGFIGCVFFLTIGVPGCLHTT